MLRLMSCLQQVDRELPWTITTANRFCSISTTPLLVDSDGAISEADDVLQWAVKTREPGHTFILVDELGKIVWIQDYGIPENRGVMYVPVEELVLEIKNNLGN